MFSSATAHVVIHFFISIFPLFFLPSHTHTYIYIYIYTNSLSLSRDLCVHLTFPSPRPGLSFYSNLRRFWMLSVHKNTILVCVCVCLCIYIYMCVCVCVCIYVCVVGVGGLYTNHFLIFSLAMRLPFLYVQYLDREKKFEYRLFLTSVAVFKEVWNLARVLLV